ncbi:MAG: SWIM zinc finger family protein [Polyangiaceae bacterium]
MTARILEILYPAASDVAVSPKDSHVRVALDASRAANVGVTGLVKHPELFRDALLTTVALMRSDLRYRGKDRTAYLAYLMKQGKKATKQIWEAQRTFLDSAYADDAPRPRGLDPVWTVDPDEFSLEVFSRDESAYARLAFDNALLEQRTASHGSALADLSPALVDQLEHVRTYQPLHLAATSSSRAKQAGADEVRPKREVELPDEWLRGFLQVQSAATLPATTVELAPIDLYNVLFALKTRTTKKPPRGLRLELIPGARPRIILEPWEVTFEAHAAPFSGKVPRIVRLFGRKRLLLLDRALSHTRSVRVHVAGPGLPSFWVLDMGHARLTLALTSWAESKWGSLASFDALMPRATKTKDVDAVIKALRAKGPMPLESVAEVAKVAATDARAELQRACLRGQVLFDPDRRVYRPRALLAEPVDEAAIRYGSPREALAHRLLGDGTAGAAAIRITKIHIIAGEGTEITGEIEDKQARRSFAPRFTSDAEGQVSGAWCNCPTFMRSAMREGPCEHMIALYIFQKRSAEEAERARLSPEGRKLIRAETRTLVRRDAVGAQTNYRLTLDDRVVRVELADAPPGQPLSEARSTKLWFDTDSEARDAYFARLDELAREGFIDTDALSA